MSRLCTQASRANRGKMKRECYIYVVKVNPVICEEIRNHASQNANVNPVICVEIRIVPYLHANHRINICVLGNLDFLISTQITWLTCSASNENVLIFTQITKYIYLVVKIRNHHYLHTNHNIICTEFQNTRIFLNHKNIRHHKNNIIFW